MIPEEDKTLLDAGVTDEPTLVDPDEFEDGDEDQEFEFVDGVDVPDPDNADEEQEVNEDDFPDDEGDD